MIVMVGRDPRFAILICYLYIWDINLIFMHYNKDRRFQDAAKSVKPYRTLSNVFPIFEDTPAYKHRLADVIAFFRSGDDGFNNCPINYKNIYTWCVAVSNNKLYAIAWNENPSVGWSFPIKRISKGPLFDQYKNNLT